MAPAGLRAARRSMCAPGELASMVEQERAKVGSEGPQLEGVAGYVSPYPYLDVLQEKMEERLARRVPARGRFCGFCYGRQRAEDTVCGFCGHVLDEVGTVQEIPQEVLRIYQGKQKTEARWVHMGAFFGLTVATFLFLYLVVWGPGLLGHPGVAFAALIGGGYLLAQFFGTFLGAQIGYRKGARKRDQAWGASLEERAKGTGQREKRNAERKAGGES